MNGRTPTKDEALYMDRCKQIGCVCCIIKGRTAPFEVPMEYVGTHHLDGQRKKDAHFKSIGICDEDHQNGPYAVHINKKVFEDEYLPSYDLLKVQYKLIKKAFGEDAVPNVEI